MLSTYFSKNYSTKPWLIRVFVVLIAIISPFAANTYLPSLPSLAIHLHANDELLEFTITAFLLGFGISQLIYGPFSDCYGRRKTIFFGIGIAVIGSLGCAMANSLSELLFARFILGCGAGASSALTRSILRDTFQGIELTKAAALNATLFSIAPMIAPLIGGYIDKSMGWEANFIFVAILIASTGIAAWLWLSETNRYLDNTAIEPKFIWRNYRALTSHRLFMGYLLCASLSMAGASAYTTMSSFLFQDILHLTAIQYGWIMMLVTSGLIIGRILNNLFISHLNIEKSILIGIFLLLVSGVTLWIPALFHLLNVTIVVIPSMIFMIGTGFIMPNAFSQSLAPFEKSAGAAAAFYGSVTLLISFIVSGIIAMLREHNQTILAITYILMALLSFLIFYFLIIKTPEEATSIILEKDMSS